MKSFQNFANNIVEAEVPDKPKIRISGPEILPMQPEKGTSKPKSKKTKIVKQSQVSADIKSSAAEKKRLEGIKKGYISPEGRVQERGIVTNRIRASALGYGDPGKDPLRYGINPANISAEKQTLFQRAVSPSKLERRAARSEIKKGVKSIVKNYPVQSGTSFRGFSRSVSQPSPSRSDISTLQRMARPETSVKSAASLSGQLGTGAGKRAQAASDAAKDISNFEKTSAYHQRILKAIKELPPEPPTTPSTPKPAPALVKPKPAVKADLEVPRKSLKVTKPLPTNVVGGVKSKIEPVAVKPKVVSVLKTGTKTAAMNADDIGKAFDQVLKNREARKAAEKSASMTKLAKGVNAAGTALSIVGSGLEAKGGYETARREGASQKRALGAGIARGVGSFVGGGVGATLGSALGLPGSIAGGAAGYSLGAKAGTAAYKAITGDPLKKLTTKDVLTNVRKAVPYEVRKQVPAGARKVFKDFVTQAGKSYGNWQRSQKQQGGNK